MLQPWLLLLLSLPPRPSSLRVRAWRRLKALGAVALKSGAYLLPYSPDRYEQFQWLAQEVEKDRGEATLLKVDRVENMNQPEVVRLFHEVRNTDYAALTDRYRKLGSAKRPRAAGELARLARELDRLVDIDFFDAPGRQQTLRAREAAERRVAGPLKAGGSPGHGPTWTASPRRGSSSASSIRRPSSSSPRPTSCRPAPFPSTWLAWSSAIRAITAH